ncbi:MAG: glycosyltransferase family 4 protein [Lentisphaerae bacterium]|nr:glycosyltransferase family 4 protein [Lentisphaerota bacterium]
MSFFDYLPAYILNHSPKIIASFEMDFLRNLSAFQKAVPQGEKFTMLLQLGWSAELPEVAEELKTRLAEAKKAFPEARFIILANAAKEVEIIKEFNEVYLASHNAFLDPVRYPLAKSGKRKFDALYIARITPFKRHELAEKIEKLHLIGSYAEKEKEYFTQTIARFPHAVWSQKVPSFFIGRKICEAACGLALSAVEGAMFSCGEYSLCGVPVVNTRNLGGRDTLLPDFAVRYAEDNADSVAENVDFFVNNPIAPAEIREGFLHLALPQKELVQDLINSIAGKKVYLPHKLNIRCRLLPHTKLLHGIRRK